MRYGVPVPFVTLARHPHLPGAPPPRVFLREAGDGPAVLLLHGGWGYLAYPYDAEIAALAARHRAVAPDRLGYGRSGRLAELADGFHQRMAEESLLVLDALGISSAAVWGHSDGSVVAAWMALLAPARVEGLVLEAFHLWRGKVGSLDFFGDGAEAPDRFGEATAAGLERDHGDGWRQVVAMGARAWLRIIRGAGPGPPDLYQGRLGEIAAPVLLLHGSRDPRTEPGEIEEAHRLLRGSRLRLVDAGHSPHSSARSGAEARQAALEFLDALPRPRR
jgi:pimeloyl-ACP methyl ester carboxylesterase